jgi:hypothetical protein
LHNLQGFFLSIIFLFFIKNFRNLYIPLETSSCPLFTPANQTSMKNIFLLFLSAFFQYSHAQQPPLEFDKGMVLNLEILQGFTKAKSFAELYLAEIRLSPQWTVAPGILRAGATGGVLYNNQKVSAFAGPSVALNLKTITMKPGAIGGSLANVQLVIEHLWGTNEQRLLGGGFRTEIGKKLLLSLLTHRDYNLNYWNVEFGIGINLGPRKKLGPSI